jgi:hypothetical protein
MIENGWKFKLKNGDSVQFNQIMVMAYGMKNFTGYRVNMEQHNEPILSPDVLYKHPVSLPVDGFYVLCGSESFDFNDYRPIMHLIIVPDHGLVRIPKIYRAYPTLHKTL